MAKINKGTRNCEEVWWKMRECREEGMEDDGIISEERNLLISEWGRVRTREWT